MKFLFEGTFSYEANIIVGSCANCASDKCFCSHHAMNCSYESLKHKS